MGNSQMPFAEKDIRRVLGSPEGQKILKMLNQDGGQALRQAANALRSGNVEEAKRLVSPIMESEEAARHSLTFMAPSKSFNMPGLQSSYAVIQDDDIRRDCKADRRSERATAYVSTGRRRRGGPQ